MVSTARTTRARKATADRLVSASPAAETSSENNQDIPRPRAKARSTKPKATAPAVTPEEQAPTPEAHAAGDPRLERADPSPQHHEDVSAPVNEATHPTSASAEPEPCGTEANTLDAALAAALARAAALEKENLLLKKKWKLVVTQAQQETAVASGSIPRPDGERGKNGWNMQSALQLEDDGDAYNAILAATRDAVRQAGLDLTAWYDEQEIPRLNACFSEMKRRHPYLERFARDWACRELVIGVLANCRKTDAARKKAAAAAATVNTEKVKPRSKRHGHVPRIAVKHSAGPVEAVVDDDAM